MNHNLTNAIIVWRFYDAPKEYQDLSPHGGDEDWIAFFPKKYYDENGIPFWTRKLGDNSEHGVEDGVILIGAHA